MQAPSWAVYPHLGFEELKAFENAGINRYLAQILYNRGIRSIDTMRVFIEARYEDTSDPLTLVDMPRTVKRIQRALEQREHITVYGDYDADGVTSSSLLFRALRTLKHPEARLDFHIPHRLTDGCGLNIKAIDALKAHGTSLLITTDCGSSDVEQVAHARALGIDVIITDHHHPPVHRPDAYAMVNPWRSDYDYKDAYDQRYFCGVGIAFKLAQALYRAYQRPQEEELALLDLVAIGTIADIAPLLGENHTLVRLGIQQLNATQKPGLLALLRSANLPFGRIRERDISYALAPRINAAGRMRDASIAFNLLITDSHEEAASYVAELEQLNIFRQQETEELMRNVREQAQHQAAHRVILVSGENWHEGIIGLVAGKLAEEINKPVLVVSNNKQGKFSRGSARSQKDFNIIAALRGFASRLERYGGHAQAAGFTISTEHIGDLHAYLLDWKEDSVAPLPARIEGTELPDATGEVTEQESTLVAPPHMVDLVISNLERLDYCLYKMLRTLSPFGPGNPEPTFKLQGLRLLDKWIGLNGRNLRLKLGTPTGTTQRIGTLSKGAHHLEALKDVSHVDIVFCLDSSEDESKQNVWLRILHVEAAGK